MNYSKRKIEMEQIKQIGSSQKSEINMEQQIKNQNRQAVVKNECHKFKTTAQASETARTMTEIMKTNKADLGMYSVMYAEQYDRAAWFEARAEYLQQRVAELEESKKDLEERMDYLQEKHEAVFEDVMKFARRNLEYGCSVCGHKFADEDDWSGRCDENGCFYCEDDEEEEEEEEEEEVFGKCFECGIIGRFIGKDSDAWLCERCSTIGGCDNDDENDIALHGTCDNCDTILYPDIHIFCFSRGEEDTTFCQECGEDLHEEMNADGWKRDDDEGEINWDEDAHSELCSAIDASGNALF